MRLRQSFLRAAHLAPERLAWAKTFLEIAPPNGHAILGAARREMHLLELSKLSSRAFASAAPFSVGECRLEGDNGNTGMHRHEISKTKRRLAAEEQIKR